MNTQVLLGVVVLGVSLLVDIIGTAIPYWWVHSAGDSSANYGLFQFCLATEVVTVCNSISSVVNWWKAVQAMMILSILVLAAAVGLGVLFCFIMTDKKMLALLSAVLGGAGAGLAILGVIIFGAKAPDAIPIGGLHAGFGLAIVAAIIALVGALLMLKSRNSD